METTIQQLRQTLGGTGLSIIREEGRMLYLEKGYTIEVEHESLFKLLHAGAVVAPFDDVVELCDFIKMDIELNG